MILLVDADVVLDVALDRSPFAAASANLLDAIQRGDAEGFIAWHTLSNVYYLLRPKNGSASVRSFLADLLSFLQVAAVSTDDAKYAVALPMADFEDALQATAAVACRADAIATRNVRHYKRSPVRADTPANLAQALGSER